MRRQFVLAVLMTVVAAIPAAADDRRSRQPDRRYGYGQDDRSYGYGQDGRSYGYGRNSYFGGNTRQYPSPNPVTAAMRELEYVFRRARVDSHEANHFRRALRELADFDRNAARGRFDRGNLNRAIDNMADLAQADQLHPRDRQLIRQRLEDLLYFRDRGARP